MKEVFKIIDEHINNSVGSYTMIESAKTSNVLMSSSILLKYYLSPIFKYLRSFNEFNDIRNTIYAPEC